MTASHVTLPFNPVVRVTNLESERTVTVRTNDRGGIVKGCIIDLSAKAAGRLGIEEDAMVKVRIEAFDVGQSTG